MKMSIPSEVELSRMSPQQLRKAALGVAELSHRILEAAPGPWDNRPFEGIESAWKALGEGTEGVNNQDFVEKSLNVHSDGVFYESLCAIELALKCAFMPHQKTLHQAMSNYVNAVTLTSITSKYSDCERDAIQQCESIVSMVMMDCTQSAIQDYASQSFSWLVAWES